MDNKQVLNLLKTRGFKHTPQRRAIIRTLVAGKNPLSVKEIVENLQTTFPEISPDTVYRNLKVLCNLGIVSEIKHQGKKGTRYEMDGKPHHHHMVCVSCGKSVCLPHCKIEEDCKTMAQESDFHLVGHNFEIFGYCSTCHKAI